MPAKDSDIISRAELIQQAVATLQLSIKQIQESGEVAPGRLLRFTLPSTR